MIQQRTLKELRAAIRPREPRRKMYLPDQFRTTTVLEDGTTVTIESEADRQMREIYEQYEIKMKKQQQDTVEIHITEQEDADRVAEALDKEKQRVVQALQTQVKQKTWMVENPDPYSLSKVPITRAERRRMIKQELMQLQEGNEKGYYQRRLY